MRIILLTTTLILISSYSFADDNQVSLEFEDATSSFVMIPEPAASTLYRYMKLNGKQEVVVESETAVRRTIGNLVCDMYVETKSSPKRYECFIHQENK